MNKKYLTEVVLLTKSYNLQDFKDWLHWHLDIIGFDCAHIFDNESSVDIKSICDEYGDKVTYEKIEGWPNQYALYNRYINNESPAWWVLPIDDDEFLYMKNFTKVNKMILHYQTKWPDMCKLSIRWENKFPKNPLDSRKTKSLLEFCTISNEKWAKLFDGGNKPVKTFVKTSYNIFYDLTTGQTHNPIIENKLSYMCNGNLLKGNWYIGPDTDTDLKLLHFQFKSKEEWIWKCRNRKRVSMKDTIGYNSKRENVWLNMIEMNWNDYCLSKLSEIQKQFPNKNIENPKTFTEKIQWLKIYDSTILKTYCSDKISLHDYCLKKLKKDICIPIIGVYEKPEEINLDLLPEKFVIKCNHGSAMNILVNDKNKLNYNNMCNQINIWLNTDYSVYGELHYKHIQRKVYIEELKQNYGKTDLIDYKLFCFNGVPKFWQVITDRRTNEKISHYDMDWNYAPIYDWKQYESKNDIPKPIKYQEMIDIAKKLSSDFKFVRVDFYVIDDEIYLGELTFTPANGKQIFKNDNTDLIIGNMLKL